MNWNQIKKNWQPTVAGLVAGAASFIAMFPKDFEHWPMLIHIAQFALVGGLSFLGIAAKGAGVTGTGDNAKSE